MTPNNQEVYRNYFQYRATGYWPDDEVTHWKAGIIYQTEQICQRIEAKENATILARASMNITGA